jgi:hypothetical protein
MRARRTARRGTWPPCRNQVRFAATTVTVPILAEPTSTQREAFTLIGAPILLA